MQATPLNAPYTHDHATESGDVTMKTLLRAVVFGLFASAAGADVTGVDIRQREDVLDARPFGDAGAYEKLAGVIHFAWDPADPANTRIADIELAPTNDHGLVEATANFTVLQPKDPAKRAGVGLLEVANRGGKASLVYFNRATGSRDPTRESDFGDAYLMDLGLTLIWVGWQCDIPPDVPDLMRIDAPIATDDAESVYGYARSDWVSTGVTKSFPLGHRGHLPYKVARPSDEGNVLTVRDGRAAPRQVIPREKWSFARATPNGPVPSPEFVYFEEGFQAGKIYEVVYHTKNPYVVGVGLAALRDTIAYAKHDDTCEFGVDTGIAFGVSQTGRLLRQFLYQGFNADEQGRIAFDGMLIHTAGAGRGSFNHRFAQPSRDAHRYSSFVYPTDIFPFSGRTQTDPLTGETDGLLAHLAPEHQPRIFYTNTGYEYWGRAASLLHTTPDGAADVEPLDNERIYHLASGQHFVGGRLPTQQPIADGSLGHLNNPLDFLYAERALLGHLVAWVADGTEPPASRYPKIADGTLVPIEQLEWPKILGVPAPTVAQVAYREDFGPRWSEGIIDNQPPVIGEAFPSLVPQVNEFANEVGGVRTVELEVPLATYTGWSLRYPDPPVTELRDFIGMIIPLPRIDKGQDVSDARPPIEALYGSKDEVMSRAREAAAALVADGFLLERDVDAVVERAGETWAWVMAR